MKQLPASQITQAVLLFPTIERMGSSPKGKIATPFLRYFRWIATLSIYPLYYIIPIALKKYLAGCYFRGLSFPEFAIQATLKLVDPSVVANSLYMAKSEMEEVVEADHDVIRANVHKLMFYYGSNDHWCPREYCTDMKTSHPSADIKLCEKGFDHAFVLEYSREMATLVWSWLTEKMPHINT